MILAVFMSLVIISRSRILLSARKYNLTEKYHETIYELEFQESRDEFSKADDGRKNVFSAGPHLPRYQPDRTALDLDQIDSYTDC